MSAARAARDWTAFDRIVAALKDLGEDETLLVQSGKPIARFRTHARAPRVIMANGVVVGRWTDEKTVFDLERAGLTITPGMTAAAWQYIGSQGILQGTWQSFAGAAERLGAATLAGRTILTAGLADLALFSPADQASITAIQTEIAGLVADGEANFDSTDVTTLLLDVLDVVDILTNVDCDGFL